MVDEYLKEIETLRKEYNDERNFDRFKTAVYSIASKYAHDVTLGNLLTNMGDEYIMKGDYDAGICIIKAVYEQCDEIADEITVYLRLAEHYIKNGDVELGTDFLMRICTETADNYEESISFRGLTDVWEKNKHLIDGKVIAKKNKAAVPKKLILAVDEILALPTEEMLAALSDHLCEKCDDGENLSYLNKWERTVFYADEVCMEVNSGGFAHYLYYYGKHFKQAKRAFEEIGALKMLELFNNIQEKFPNKRIPTTIDRIKNVLDDMEEKGIDFEQEDEIFYESAEEELFSCMTSFILENRYRFRD